MLGSDDNKSQQGPCDVFDPGCVGRGVRLGSESSSGGAGGAGGVWESGNLGILKSGNLEIWKFWIQQFQEMKIRKIKIRVTQNVGKVWNSRKQIPLAPFPAISNIFLQGREKSGKCRMFAYFPWWAHGPYSPDLGPCCYPPLVGMYVLGSQLPSVTKNLPKVRQ